MRKDLVSVRQPGITQLLAAKPGEDGKTSGPGRLYAGAVSLVNSRGGALVSALFVALVLLVLPPSVAWVDADSSWSAVLSYAHQKGWQFGTQIVFTYGPAEFLITPWALGQPLVLRMVSAISLSLVVAVGLCLVAWRVRSISRLLLLGTIILLAPNIPLRTDLLLYIGLLCWGTLCLVEGGGMLVMAAACFLCLAAFASFIKMTFFFTAALSIGALACDFVLRGRFRLAICLAIGFGAAIAVGWVLLGQNLSHFGSFLVNGLAISLPYNEAQAYAPPPHVKWGGMATAVVALTMTIAGTLTAHGPDNRRAGWGRGLLLAWMGSLVFITWKHGFVVAERAHIGYFLIFVPALALALEALPRESRVGRAAVGSLGAVGCVLCALTLQSAFFPAYLNFCARRPLRAIAQNMRTIANPTKYWQRLNRDLALERQRTHLPRLRRIVGSAGADVFGYNQAYSWYNQFNYQPRPVFQSYSAYSPFLMRLNEDYYASKSAPEYVLFSLTPTEHRFPPLEDALVLRDILA